ncbi:ABC transporter ATP-binding protein [Caldanaerobacter subterraneus KAk]|uniref:ABC transporter ATP-binding protein n=1 Tax=Caldanaerobacter subterraneus TaxID=911092 RepID=UPI0032C1777B
MEKLLVVNGLKTYFFTKTGVVKAVDGVTFELEKGKLLAIVGESGSGKSVTVTSIMRLIPHPGKILGGEIIYKNIPLLKLSQEKMRRFRGNEISMIFQDPMSSLNPTIKIGRQIMEPLLWHKKAHLREARERALEMLKEVGISSPKERFNQYPFELSGGMKQRVMIAMALINEPELLIADEPTTSLDVTIQAQILRLICDMKEKRNMSVILITHNLAVATSVSEDVMVMYAGKVMEKASTREIIDNPLHPYTEGLFKATPVLKAGKVLVSIPGQPPDLRRLPKGCPFSERCSYRKKQCENEIPPLTRVSDTHYVSCWLYS